MNNVVAMNVAYIDVMTQNTDGDANAKKKLKCVKLAKLIDWKRFEIDLTVRRFKSNRASSYLVAIRSNLFAIICSC